MPPGTLLSAPLEPARTGRPRRPHLQSLGLTSREVSLEGRERLVRAARELPAVLGARFPQLALVVVETCHRLELLWVDRHVALEPHLRAHLRAVAPEADLLLRRRRGAAAVRHLFDVALGLDSPIPGEREVARQLRRAWHAAQDERRSHPLLDRAIAAALGAVTRANAADARATSSIAAESVRQLRARVNGDWSRARVVVLGAGMVAREVVRELLVAPPASVTVVARRFQAWPAEVHVRQWERRQEVLRQAELVIVATGADAPILGPSDLAGTPVRQVVDLALPRNVDPAVTAAGRVEVVDLDMVLRMRWTPDRAEADRLRARRQVGRRDLARFRAREALREAGPALGRLHEEGERIAAEEVARALGDLRHPDAGVREAVASLSDRLARRLLYRMSLTAREVASIATR